MKKRRRLITVSVVLMLLGVGDFFIMQAAGDADPLLVRGWRLFLTALLALFLALGKNTARWIVVILTALGAVAGLAAVAMLAISGALGDDSGHLLIWLGFVSVAYGIIAAFLGLSSGVTREIRRAAKLI